MLVWKCNILKIVLKYHNCKTDKIPFKFVHNKKNAVRPVETVNQANIHSFVTGYALYIGISLTVGPYLRGVLMAIQNITKWISLVLVKHGLCYFENAIFWK